MYKYAKLKAAAAAVTAISLLILAVFSIKIWIEEKHQTCATQLATYTQVVDSLAALRVSSMDKQNVAARTIAELRTCVLPELEELPEVEESNTLN
tara:strand:+ start:142 stop:426 length:285 start_codon:yes stop_codon:yes gene_type:complete